MKNYPQHQAYLNKYRGKTIALDLSGAMVDYGDLAKLKADINTLSREGIRLVITGGGCCQDELKSWGVELQWGVHATDDELILMGKPSGITKGGGETIPFISKDDLKGKLSGKDNGDPPLDDNSIRWAEDLVKMVPFTKKAVVTGVRNLMDELLIWNGGGQGTMCADLDAKTWGPTSEMERDIVGAMIEDQVRAGKFRGRSEREVAEAIDNYRLLKVKESILGGTALNPRGSQWFEMTHYLSGYKGIGQRILEGVRGEAEQEGRAVFAVTGGEGAKKSFEDGGFIPIASFSQEKKAYPIAGCGLPPGIANYPEPDPKKLVYGFFPDGTSPCS